jgi:hypothetical protein
MQVVLSQASKVMVDTKNGNPLLYVPLDQFLKNQNAPKKDDVVDVLPKLPTEKSTDTGNTVSGGAR